MWFSTSRFILFLLVITYFEFGYGNVRYVDWNAELSNEITLDEQIIQPNGRQLTFTFPGTRWCGPGNTANNYNDLGTEKEADMCCRDHDNCDNIPAGESKHNLTNNGMFTRLHCECDHSFYNCLKKARTMVANEMGYLYFDTIHSYCYMEEYPIKRCRKSRQWFLQKRCVDYEFDTSKPKQWQWFDLPIWK